MLTCGGDALRKILRLRTWAGARAAATAIALVGVALVYAAGVWVLSVHRLPEQPMLPTNSFQIPHR